MGLARQSVYMDQGHSCRRLPRGIAACAVWPVEPKKLNVVVGHAGSFGSVSGAHGLIAALGSGTPGTFLSDLHTTTVAQLAGEGCVHHCRILAGAGCSFLRKLGGIDNAAELVDDCRDSLVDL